MPSSFVFQLHPWRTSPPLHAAAPRPLSLAVRHRPAAYEMSLVANRVFERSIIPDGHSYSEMQNL